MEYKILCGNTDITEYITSIKSSIEFDSETPLIGNAPSIKFDISIDNTLRIMDDILLGNQFYIYQNGLKIYTLNITDMPEFIYERLDLTLYDNLIKTNVSYKTNTQMYPCTVVDQLEEMKSLLNLNIDYSNIPSHILSRTINQYDTGEFIRIYLCQIAEASCCNVFCNENGDIYFKKVSKDVVHDIENDDHVYSFSKSNKVTITMVVAELLNLYMGDESGSLLKITENNPYISTQEELNYIFDEIGGITFDSIESLNMRYIDGISVGEIVRYKDYFNIFARKIETTYHNGEKAHDVVMIDGKFAYVGKSNYIGDENFSSKFKRLKINVDEQNFKLDIIAKNVDHQTELLKNSINVSLSLNYVNTQTRDEELDKYYPDYNVNPLKITAIAKDTLKEVIANAVFTFKRKGQNDEEFVDLLDEEMANDNVLTISHNLTESTEYIAYAIVTTEEGTILTAENSISINYNLIKSMEVDGSMCSIVTTTNDFVYGENDYEPNNIVLTPQLFSCNFDSYSYSTDLGLSYTVIEIGDEIVEEVEDEEPQALDGHMFYTNIEGVHFNNETNELIVQSSAKCFDLTNVVIFKLKTDVQGYENTTTLTKTTDVNYQLNNIMSEINALVEENKNLSLQLDGLNNTISTKVEEIETTYTDDMTAIKQQLSNVIQTATSIEEQFITLKEIIDENGSDLQTITTYIRKTAKGIEVGELDANVKTLMGTSYFAILFNDEEKMTLEQNLLTIENVKALMGFQLGNSIFTSHDNGFYITWGGD